jgi:hypothetical protein
VIPRIPWLRFLWAALISVVLHGLVIALARVPVPERSSVLPPLQARLEPHPPAPKARPAEKPAAREKLRAGRPASQPASAPIRTGPSPSVAPEPESFSTPSGETAAEPLAAESPSELPSPTEAPVFASTESEAPAPVISLPRKGRITYTIYLGTERFSVGRTIQSWEFNGTEYELASVSETTGIVELFRAQRLVYLSKGRLIAGGLQPESFLVSRTRRGRTEEAFVRFDWNAHTLKLVNPPHHREMPLPPAAQDVVSFMYQFALSPPAPGLIRLAVTNGSRFETYELEVLAEERIETPLGVLNTLPIRQVRRPGSESVALWLATDHYHLPVRLRFFDRAGNPSGEQIAERIEIDETP